MDQSLEIPFIGMNIHLPAILVFTMGIGFWPISIFLVLNALGGMQHAHKNPSLWKDTPGGMAMPCYACLVSKFLQHRWCKWVERVCFYHIPKHISNHISNHDNSHLGCPNSNQIPVPFQFWYFPNHRQIRDSSNFQMMSFPMISDLSVVLKGIDHASPRINEHESGRWSRMRMRKAQAAWWWKIGMNVWVKLGG